MSRPPLQLNIWVRPFMADPKLVPANALIAYFKKCNVALGFAWGAPLNYDVSDPIYIGAFEKQYRPPPGQTGPTVLVLAQQSPDGPLVNGALLNPEKRGIIAVYTGSDAFVNGDDETRFQIFVHEIGHLVNLVHADADASFPTAMEQFDERQSTLPILAAWKASNATLTPEDRTRFRAYFTDQPQLVGLPMSRTCLEWAARQQLGVIAPWLSGFRDFGQSTSFDKGSLGLSMSCIPHETIITLGQGLDFTLTLSLRASAEAITIPSHIGLRFGNLKILVQELNGPPVMLQAKSHTCAAGHAVLKPGRRWRAAYSFLRDRHALVFTSPGQYRIDVSIPTLGLRAPSMMVEVTQPVVDEFRNSQFLKFLGGPMHLTSRSNWKKLERLVEEPSTPSGIRATLAELCILASPDSAKSEHLLQLVLTLPDVPQRVQERLALARCKVAARANDDLTAPLADARKVFKRTDGNHPALKTVIKQSNHKLRPGGN